MLLKRFCSWSLAFRCCCYRRTYKHVRGALPRSILIWQPFPRDEAKIIKTECNIQFFSLDSYYRYSYSSSSSSSSASIERTSRNHLCTGIHSSIYVAIHSTFFVPSFFLHCCCCFDQDEDNSYEFAYGHVSIRVHVCTHLFLCANGSVWMCDFKETCLQYLFSQFNSVHS